MSCPSRMFRGRLSSPRPSWGDPGQGQGWTAWGWTAPGAGSQLCHCVTWASSFQSLHAPLPCWGAHGHLPSGPPGGPGREAAAAGRGMEPLAACVVPARQLLPSALSAAALWAWAEAGSAQRPPRLLVLGLRLQAGNPPTPKCKRGAIRGAPGLCAPPSSSLPWRKKGGGGQCLGMVDWWLGWRDAGQGEGWCLPPHSSAPSRRPPSLLLDPHKHVAVSLALVCLSVSLFSPSPLSLCRIHLLPPPVSLALFSLLSTSSQLSFLFLLRCSSGFQKGCGRGAGGVQMTGQSPTGPHSDPWANAAPPLHS